MATTSASASASSAIRSDRAKLLLRRAPRAGEAAGYLPLLSRRDPINPSGRPGSDGFPDNWTIGMSFYHNLFAREHNAFVDEFRRQAAATPDADSGLRNPAKPDEVIRYKDVTPDELFEVARLVVAAEIAKIHTIEWTPQLLYDEPLYLGMNANWSGLLRRRNAAGGRRAGANRDAELRQVRRRQEGRPVVFGVRLRPGNFRAGQPRLCRGPDVCRARPNKNDIWDIRIRTTSMAASITSGRRSTFPRSSSPCIGCIALVPDLIEYRDGRKTPNAIHNKMPVIETFRGKATDAMRDARAGQLGAQHGAAAAGPAGAAKPSALPAEPADAAAGSATARSTWRRSI